MSFVSSTKVVRSRWSKTTSMNEGTHYRKNLRAAKRGTPLQLKDSFAVPIDVIFAVRLPKFFILG